MVLVTCDITAEEIDEKFSYRLTDGTITSYELAMFTMFNYKTSNITREQLVNSYNLKSSYDINLETMVLVIKKLVELYNKPVDYILDSILLPIEQELAITSYNKYREAITILEHNSLIPLVIKTIDTSLFSTSNNTTTITSNYTNDSTTIPMSLQTSKTSNNSASNSSDITSITSYKLVKSYKDSVLNASIKKRYLNGVQQDFNDKSKGSVYKNLYSDT